jgi:hypothetical protein
MYQSTGSRMANEPAAEESTRRILDLFVHHFHLRVGGTLSLSDFLGKFQNDGFRNLHFPDGMQFAINNGWVEPNRRNSATSYSLTSAGFGEGALRKGGYTLPGSVTCHPPIWVTCRFPFPCHRLCPQPLSNPRHITDPVGRVIRGATFPISVTPATIRLTGKSLC